MQYDNYQRKVNKTVDVIKRILSHIKLIITIFSIFILVISAYLIFKGTIYGETECPDSVVYGESLGFSAKSFLSNMTYEYFDLEAAKWRQDNDLTPGNYKVRGVSKRAFGQYSYTNEYEFSVLPKEIDIILSNTAVYGDDPIISADTAYGDTVICERFIYGNDKALSTDVYADIASLKIINTRGEDVTNSYIITALRSTIRIIPRPVTIDIIDSSKVYDGKKLSSDVYNITDGSVKEGDVLKITFDKAIIDVGTIDNDPSVKLSDGQGNDISHLYNLTLNIGKLEIYARPILITTQGAQYTYSGNEIVNSEFTVDPSTSPIQGHKLVIKNAPVFVNAGTYNNAIEFDVVDSQGNSNRHNYDISVRYGTIYIAKAPLHISTDSLATVYDGIEHSAPKITVKGLLSNHKLEHSKFVSVSSVGKYTNKIDIEILDSNRSIITQNYDISCNFGTIEITKRPLTIVTPDITRTYNGLPVNGGSYSVEGLVTFHILQATSSEITDVGSIINELHITGIYDARGSLLSSSLSNTNSENLIDNYEITAVYGTITVTPRSITISVPYEVAVYNGLSQLPTAAPFVSNLISSHSLADYELNGALTDVGKSEITIVPQSVRIVDSERKDVTKNYSIKHMPSSFEVIRREIWLQSGSVTKRYDGTPLTCNEIYVRENSPNQLAYRHYIKADDPSASQTEIGSQTNTFNVASVRILDKNGNDVTSNYLISNTQFGQLEVIHSAVITVKTKDGSKTYNGKNFSYPEYSCEISEGSLFPGHRVVVSDFAQLLNAGSIPNSATVRVIDAQGKNVKHLYEVNTEWGTLTVNPAKLTVYSSSESFVYDGEEHRSIFTRTSGFLAENASVAVIKSTSATNAGDYTNEIKVMIYESYGIESFTDVSKNYDITYVFGTITITKRPLKVSTVNSSWVYDGQPHNTDKGSIITEGLVEKHTFNAETAEITDTGKITNEILSYTITDSINGGGDLSENYDVSFSYGSLSVTKRPLSLSPKCEPKVYDGNPYPTPKNINAEGLVDSHKVAFEYSYSTETPLVNVGIRTIEIVSDSVKIFDANGRNVTGNYLIAISRGEIKITRRPVEIQTGSASKIYDGTPLTNDRFTAKNLLAGHRAVITVNGSQTEIGCSPNTIDWHSIEFYDQNGRNVTRNYYVTESIKEGTLTVKSPTGIHISTASDSKYYDGTPLTNGNYSITLSGELVDGDYVSVDVIGSIVGIGEALNDAIIKVFDEAGNERTHLYNITTDFGTLSVIERPEGSLYGKVYASAKLTLYLRSESYGDFKNGAWQSAVSYGKTLPGGYSLNYLTSFALNNLGFEPAEILISDNIAYKLPYYPGFSGDYDIPENDTGYRSARSEYSVWFYNAPYLSESYSFLRNNLGELSEYELEYASFVYSNYLYVDPETLSYMESIINEMGFSLDDANIIQKVSEYIRNAATYNLDYDTSLDTDENMIIAFLDEYKEGVCRHYASAAVMLYRSLGIPARYVTGFKVETEANEWTPIKSPGHAWVEVYIEGLGWIYVEVTGNSDGENGSEGGSGIGSAANNDRLTLSPEFMYKEYDGEPLVAANQLAMTDALKKLLEEGYTYSVKIVGSQTEVGIGLSKIIEFSLYDPYGIDVTDDFSINYEDGILCVSPQTIYVALFELHKFYDGNPLKYSPNDYYLISELPEGTSLDLEITIELIEAGSIYLSEINTNIEKYAQYKIFDKDGADVTERYRIVFLSPEAEENYAPITVERRIIELTSASVTYVFNDAVLQDDNVYISKGSLSNGDILIAKATGTLDHIGSTKNTLDISSIVILNSLGEIVTGNYDIITVEGTLTLFSLSE